ncbi:MAG: hypothetical protein K2K08_06265 [Paramuribaculum sp.]|nr:hypothetical protein [Paramuribaculum sp.]
MKALFISAAIATVATFSACSSSEKAQQEESALASKIENCTNTDSLKAYLEEAKEYVIKLQSEGKLDEAKAFLDKIQPVVDQKAPALASTFATVKESIDKLTDVASDKIDSTKTAVTDSVAAKVESAKAAVSDKASETVEQAKDAAADATEKAKDAAADAAQKAKAAAADAAQKAADKIKGL